MARHWCSIQNKWKPRASESRRATTSRTNKTSKNIRLRACRKIGRKFEDAKIPLHCFCSRPGIRHRGEREKGAGAAGRQAERTFARPRKCDRSALRLFSAVAKEGAAVETRARCRS